MRFIWAKYKWKWCTGIQYIEIAALNNDKDENIHCIESKIQKKKKTNQTMNII